MKVRSATPTATLSNSYTKHDMMNPKTLRIVFMGTPEFAVPSLRRLVAEGYNVVGAVTVPDKPAGRGRHLRESDVKIAARELGVPVLQPEKFRDPAFLDALQALQPDLGIVIAFKMLPEVVWAMPRLGTFNLHASLLPQYRGAAPINWAVINGERETGATLHVMTERADRGDIVDRQAVPIEFTDTAYDVFMKVAEAARQIVARRLPELEAGSAPRRPQDESAATCFGRRRPEDGKIDWSKSAEEIYNLIRAVTHPFPGAFTELAGKKYYIWKARPIEGGAKPHTIVSENPPVIGTGDGLLEILRLQPEGGEEGETLQ